MLGKACIQCPPHLTQRPDRTAAPLTPSPKCWAGASQRLTGQKRPQAEVVARGRTRMAGGINDEHRQVAHVSSTYPHPREASALFLAHLGMLRAVTQRSSTPASSAERSCHSQSNPVAVSNLTTAGNNATRMSTQPGRCYQSCRGQLRSWPLVCAVAPRPMITWLHGCVLVHLQPGM